MAVEYTCPDCDQTFREDTWEGLIKRAAGHRHEHHGGPESVTPEVEGAIRAGGREVA